MSRFQFGKSSTPISVDRLGEKEGCPPSPSPARSGNLSSLQRFKMLRAKEEPRLENCQMGLQRHSFHCVILLLRPCNAVSQASAF